MLDNRKLIELADEAERAGDLVLVALFLHLAALRNLGDYRSIEMLRNFAGLRAKEGCQETEEWPEFIEG